MVGGGGGLQDFSVSPRPLGFGFLGLGVWGLGLTIYKVLLAEETPIMLKNFSYIFQSYLSLPLPKADNGKGNQG